jgi:hypothetical protein
MKPLPCAGVLLVLLLSSVGQTRAEMISYSFQGSEKLPAGNAVPLSGSVTYDANGQLLSATSGAGATSVFSTSGTITITIPQLSQTFSTEFFPATPLLVSLTRGSIAFHYESPGPRNRPGPGHWLNLDLQLGDGSSTLFSDPSVLPRRLGPSISGGSYRIVAQLGDPGLFSQGVLSGITPASVAALPEPSALGLAVVGLGGLALAARWRRASR